MAGGALWATSKFCSASFFFAFTSAQHSLINVGAIIQWVQKKKSASFNLGWGGLHRCSWLASHILFFYFHLFFFCLSFQAQQWNALDSDIQMFACSVSCMRECDQSLSQLQISTTRTDLTCLHSVQNYFSVGKKNVTPLVCASGVFFFLC